MELGDPDAPPGKSLIEADVAIVINRSAVLTGRCSYVIAGTGSMAPLAAAPDYVRLTIDIDLYPLDAAADIIDQQKERDLITEDMGLGTVFVEAHEFFVQPVDSWTTAHLPSGWFERTTVVETMEGVKAHCLAPIDLCLCKLGAGRNKDIIHIANLFDAGLVDEEELRVEMARVRAKQPFLGDKQDRTLAAALEFRAERIERGEVPQAGRRMKM